MKHQKILIEMRMRSLYRYTLGAIEKVVKKGGGVDEEQYQMLCENQGRHYRQKARIQGDRYKIV